MALLREFLCECGELLEDYTDSSVREIKCSCGKMAKRIISAPAFFKIDGFRSTIHGDAWARTREKRFKKKMMEEN